MAKLPIGILGPVSGKVGNVVGGSWRGIDYLRSMPANVTNPRTEAQLSQRGKFVLMVRFLQPVLEYVRIGFKPHARQMSTYNAAMSYNMRNALEGTFPDYTIRYEDVLLSRGNLRPVSNLTLAEPNALELQVNWDDNSTMANALSTDRVMLLVYNLEERDAFFDLNAGTRGDGQSLITLPPNYSGKEVHVWLSLTNLPGMILAGDKNSMSNSVYAGSITLS